jgi:hypothetical protein
MESLCQRFPSVIELVLDNLDDKNLVNCREASRKMSEFLPKGRFFWMRIIKHYSAKFGSFENSWRQVIDKTSVEAIKELALEVQNFFGHSHKSNGFTITKIKQIAPLHIVVEQKNLKLCEHILDRTEDKNPKGDMTLFYTEVSIGSIFWPAPTPLHIAALKGHLQICSLMIGHIDVKEYINMLRNLMLTPLHLYIWLPLLDI